MELKTRGGRKKPEILDELRDAAGLERHEHHDAAMEIAETNAPVARRRELVGTKSNPVPGGASKSPEAFVQDLAATTERADEELPEDEPAQESPPPSPSPGTPRNVSAADLERIGNCVRIQDIGRADLPGVVQAIVDHLSAQ